MTCWHGPSKTVDALPRFDLIHTPLGPDLCYQNDLMIRNCDSRLEVDVSDVESFSQKQCLALEVQ